MAKLLDKFQKVYGARAKLEAELNKIYGDFKNAVDKQDRKVKIESLIGNAKMLLLRVVDNNKELFDLAQMTEHPDNACKYLDKW